MAQFQRRIAKLATTLKSRGVGQTVRHYAALATLPVRHRVGQTAKIIKALGLQKGVPYMQEKKRSEQMAQQKASGGETATEHYQLDAPGLLHPVAGRRGSSDIYVFEQMFVMHEYACLPDLGSVKTIVDCGANVGYASAYMLSRFPEARVVSIEPDSGNFALLQKNTAPYGDRVSAVQAGVWSHPADLVVRRAARGGEEWAFTVEECGPGEAPDVRAVGVGDIMARYGMDSIDILKVDIEGSEKEVFAQNTADWINKVRLLVMELHGPDCEAIVEKAIAHRKPTVTRYEELTVFHFADA